MTGYRLSRLSFQLVLQILIWTTCALLLLPLIVIVAASFGTDSFIRFPPRGFTLKWYADIQLLRQFADPFVLSLKLAFGVALICGVLGALTALSLQRSFVRAGRYLENVFLAPVLLPTLVVGLSLLMLFSFVGLRNSWLTLLIGHLVVTMPFVIQLCFGLVHSLNARLEHAAMTLGATPSETLVKVVLPAMRSGIIAGGLIAFSLSFDEFVVSILLSRAGATTFPVEMFQYMRFSANPTVAAVSSLMIAGTLVLIWIFHRLVGIEVLFGIMPKSRDKSIS